MPQNDEIYESFDDIGRKPSIKIPSTPPPSVIRPPSPSNRFGGQQADALAAHQANLAAQLPFENRNILSLPEFGLQNGRPVPANSVRDLPIMQNYPLSTPFEQSTSEANKFLSSAYESGKGVVSDIGSMLQHAITKPAQYQGGPLQKLVVDPAIAQYQKATAPNATGFQQIGHGAAAALPFLGPMAADVSEELPQAIIGPTGEERAEAQGRLMGPVLAGEGIAAGLGVIGAGAKGAGRVYRDAGQKRLTTGYARLSNAADVPIETVEAAYPYFDKFLRETKGTTPSGSPRGSAIYPTRARGIEGMDPESLANTARHAEIDFQQKNIAPVENQLNSIPVNASQIAVDALNGLDPVFKQTVKRTGLPPQLKSVGQLLLNAQNLGDLFKLRKSLNGTLKSIQDNPRLSQADFVRSDPRGQFLDNVIKQTRKMIDDTIDVNAGQIGQTAEVLKTYSHLKDFADGLEAGAERAVAQETKQLGKRGGKVRAVAETAASFSPVGFWGSKGRTLARAAQAVEGQPNLPSSLIKSAGKQIERRGNLGLTPPGRSAMFQPPDIGWNQPMQFGPQTVTGPILGGPNAFNAPPTVNVPPTIYQNMPFTGPQTIGPQNQLQPGQPFAGPQGVSPQIQLPPAPSQPPVVTPPPPVRLPQGQVPRQLGPGVYEAGEGELGNVIRQENVRQPEGFNPRAIVPEEGLKVSDVRSVNPETGELNVPPNIPEAGTGGLSIIDRRAEFEKPTQFSTAPERMQGQPTREEMVSGLSERNRSTPEQLTEEAPAKTKVVRPKRTKPVEAKTEAKIETKVPKETGPSKWEMKEVGEGKIDLYKNGVKMFEEPLSKKEATNWIRKRILEEKDLQTRHGGIGPKSDEELLNKLLESLEYEPKKSQESDYPLGTSLKEPQGTFTSGTIENFGNVKSSYEPSSPSRPLGTFTEGTIERPSKIPTNENLSKIIDEVEKRWRSRTPAKTIDEVDAGTRVSRGEMRLIAKQLGISLDETDPAVQAKISSLFMRLKKEFPKEKWGNLNARTKAFNKEINKK